MPLPIIPIVVGIGAIWALRNAAKKTAKNTEGVDQLPDEAPLTPPASREEIIDSLSPDVPNGAPVPAANTPEARANAEAQVDALIENGDEKSAEAFIANTDFPKDLREKAAKKLAETRLKNVKEQLAADIRFIVSDPKTTLTTWDALGAKYTTQPEPLRGECIKTIVAARDLWLSKQAPPPVVPRPVTPVTPKPSAPRPAANKPPSFRPGLIPVEEPQPSPVQDSLLVQACRKMATYTRGAQKRGDYPHESVRSVQSLAGLTVDGLYGLGTALVCAQQNVVGGRPVVMPRQQTIAKQRAYNAELTELAQTFDNLGLLDMAAKEGIY